MALAITENVPLAPRTTLELGGPARFFAEAHGEADVAEALAWADARGVPIAVLGGGSNLVVADAGFDGLVLRLAMRGVAWRDGGGGDVLVDAAAGEPWDEVVAAAVARGLAGIECLSGIPGSTGATPVQNVGAYGQEVAETIAAVRVVDRRARAADTWLPEACAFGYRDSAFKRDPGRAVVTAVTFRLRRHGAPALRYAELKAAFADEAAPSLGRVREGVLGLRRRKSMVIEEADPNRRSVGSFFTNPIVAAAAADRVAEIAVRAGLCAAPAEMPRFAAGAGAVKLAAGWLIERAGFGKGYEPRGGAVGVSTRHALALVHHGGGTTAALLALAREIRDGVRARFGVTLVPEPCFLGVAWD